MTSSTHLRIEYSMLVTLYLFVAFLWDVLLSETPQIFYSWQLTNVVDFASDSFRVILLYKWELLCNLTEVNEYYVGWFRTDAPTRP
jgi:VanZ family protein